MIKVKKIIFSYTVQPVLHSILYVRGGPSCNFNMLVDQLVFVILFSILVYYLTISWSICIRNSVYTPHTIVWVLMCKLRHIPFFKADGSEPGYYDNRGQTCWSWTRHLHFWYSGRQCCGKGTVAIILHGKFVKL